MKCNYKPPKLTKEEQQELASVKSTLPYIDRLQIQWRNSETICYGRGIKLWDEDMRTLVSENNDET